MKNNKKILSGLLLSASFAVLSCGDKPLITDLIDNRISVVVKGTFESNNPQGWDNSTFVNAGGWVNSINSSTLPTTFFLDLSEIRINGDKFANERLLRDMSISDSEGFFSNSGIVLENDDITPNTDYTEIELYLRKMGFDAAYNCDTAASPWTTIDSPMFFFKDSDVYGYDFNLKQVRKNGAAETDDNIVFPVLIPIPGNFNFDNEGSWVIEVRFVVKNNIVRYTNSTDKISFWALDDKIVPVPNDQVIDTDHKWYIGGNIAAIARGYKIGKTGTLDCSGASGNYIVAIPDTDDIATYISGKIPPLVIKRSETSVITNVPVGSYKAYSTSASMDALFDATPGDYSQLNGGASVVITVPDETVSVN